MRIDRRVYKYIEYEMYHYNEYKQELQLAREEILESSPPPPDGLPKGNMTGNPTESKAIRLNEDKSINSMQEVVNAIEVSLKMLAEGHQRLFEEVYCNGRKGVYSICKTLGVAERTYWKYKNELVVMVAAEMGKIKKFA